VPLFDPIGNRRRSSGEGEGRGKDHRAGAARREATAAASTTTFSSQSKHQHLLKIARNLQGETICSQTETRVPFFYFFFTQENG